MTSNFRSRFHKYKSIPTVEYEEPVPISDIQLRKQIQVLIDDTTKYQDKFEKLEIQAKLVQATSIKHLLKINDLQAQIIKLKIY